MIDSIKTVAVLGASGTIGGLTGGVIAQTGRKVYFLSRTVEGSHRGCRRAVEQARSEVISRNIVCGDYGHLLADALKEADWVIEAVAEDIAIKRQMHKQAENLKRPDAIVSSTTSSIPLAVLAEGRTDNFKSNFLSTHFYNPPGKMLACEVTGHKDTDPEVVDFMKQFLHKELRRVVVPVKDTAGFAGNRIAFLLFSRITALAVKYGVETMDYLIGPYTGRLIPPLATLDLVGLDIHRAIIANLKKNTNDEMHDWLMIPDYINTMIDKRLLGNKTKGGFYRKLESGRFLFIDPATCEYIEAISPHVAFVEKAKHFTHLGMYKDAFGSIRAADCKEANIVMDILCAYVAYSYSRIGEVTEHKYGIEPIDAVMSFGFNWAAPSVIVEMLGGKELVAQLLIRRGMSVPKALLDDRKATMTVMNSGKYFIAK